MINLSASVRKTAGGMYRAVVSATVDGVQKFRESERVCNSLGLAWEYAQALRVAVRDEMSAGGFLVAP